jgi:membrane protein implicated in regulation of membrane protease activity
MTTKKIILIVLGVFAVCVLLVLIFVGTIVGIAFYSVANSQAALTAKDFLRNNAKLKSDIGEVKDFGSIVTGSVNIDNNRGQATINLKVIGDKKNVNASVQLVYLNGQTWRVISANYVNDSGTKVNLLDPYESKRIIPLLIG